MGRWRSGETRPTGRSATALIIRVTMTVIFGNVGDEMNEQDAEMLQQINQFLDAISPPDPDGMY